MGAQIRTAGPIDRASKDIPSEKNDLERGSNLSLCLYIK